MNVERFLKLFTDLPPEEIGRLVSHEGAAINDAKVALATAATAMLHGEEAARAAEETARATFAGGGGVGAELPTLTVPEGEIGIVQALTGLGFAASNGEARRKLGEGAVKVDDTVVSDPYFSVSVTSEPVKISLGKKKHGLLTRS